MSDKETNGTAAGEAANLPQDGRPAQDSALYSLGDAVSEFAREQAIPLDPDHALTGRLAQVVPADQIPEQVYAAVAALLAFVRDTEEAAGE